MIGAPVNRPRLPRTVPATWAFLLCPWLFACNQVLGIDEPKEEPVAPTRETPGSTGTDAELGEPSKPSGQPPEQMEPPDPLGFSPYAWAAWPMPHPASLAGAANPQNFQQTSEVVIDSVTKLKWQKMADATLRTREEAKRYCDGLRIKGESFRLPSRIELLSLVDFTRSTVYLDEEAFPNERAGKYWTSSAYAKDSRSGWAVNFEFGTTLVGIEAVSKKLSVRCVR